jgi:hypothetical protein
MSVEVLVLLRDTIGWTLSMHDARTHGHTSAESSSETLRHTQVSGTETRSVNPAQNTDHELIYQRAAVSQPSMQNDVSMAPISARAQSTADPHAWFECVKGFFRAILM